MRVLNLLLLCIGATTALVYHPSSLLQHRGTHVLLSSEADEAEAEEPVAADPPAPAAAADGEANDDEMEEAKAEKRDILSNDVVTLAVEPPLCTCEWAEKFGQKKNQRRG